MSVENALIINFVISSNDRVTHHKYQTNNGYWKVFDLCSERVVIIVFSSNLVR